MSKIIQVSNLSKSYTISHEGRERYTALRDVVSQKAKKIFSFPKSLTSALSSTTTKEEFWALKDVSFEIEQGDRVGIIGRNGAGKSTLLKILSRIIEPTSGEIKIKGRVASLLEVGTGFHPELTGRENIFLNGAILGMSRAEIKKHFDAIVDFAEVEKFLDTPVKRYSSGMYVRLAFAVAAHLEPEILVVDEVLAVGDAEFQKKCLGKMEDVSKNGGRTVLFVSHNLAAITSLCFKCLLFNNGNLVDFGKTEKVIDKYILSGKNNEGEIKGTEIIYQQKYTGAQFETIRIVNSKDVLTNSFGINEEIKIELIYTVFRDGEIITPSIHILDNLGNCIMATFNASSANMIIDPFYGEPLKKGTYSAVCKIPSFMLNDITYMISCYLVPKMNNEMVIVREALTFNVYETGEMRKEYTGGWIGVIRPKLSWCTSRLELNT
jgi:lipopolysaccharide transport system ATP-binding protein